MMDNGRLRRYRFLILALVLLCFAGATALLWQPLTAFASDPASLHRWLHGHGPLGVALFAGLNMVQVVVAVIPGGPFEVAAGYLFGAFWGTVLCDCAMTAASVLVFLLVKRLGLSFIRLFFSQAQIDSVRLLRDTHRLKPLLFALFLVPGTPKDLMTYLAGLTALDLKSWVFICAVGRLPAILFSALGGSALGEERYGIAVAVGAALAVGYLAGGYCYRRLNRAKDE